jgi:hypothetical protein
MSPSIRFRLLFPIVAASALLLATAGGVLAKCEHDPSACEGMSATLFPGGTLMAGGSETVGVLVLEDEQPFAATAVELVFNRVSDATTIRAVASPVGPDGRWEATVTLPAGGTWTTAAVVQGPGYAGTFSLDTISVQPPGSPATPTSSTGPMVPPVLPLVLIGAVALGAVTIVRLGRRDVTPARG